MTAAALVSSTEAVWAQPRHAANAPGQIVVLGDSLAVSPSRADNFVVELEKRLTGARANMTVVNAGIRGDITAGGLRRVKSVLTPDTRILIVELGANDGLRGVELNAIERNLTNIIEAAQQKGIDVLLCGMMVPPRYGWQYAVGFPQVFERLAATFKVPLVPFILEGVALNPDLNGHDGIHPNAAGARRIADTVWKYLQPMLQAQAAPVSQAGGDLVR